MRLWSKKTRPSRPRSSKVFLSVFLSCRIRQSKWIFLLLLLLLAVAISGSNKNNSAAAPEEKSARILSAPKIPMKSVHVAIDPHVSPRSWAYTPQPHKRTCINPRCFNVDPGNGVTMYIFRFNDETKLKLEYIFFHLPCKFR